MLGKIEGSQEKGTTEDEMVGWHYRLDGHEFEQALGIGEDFESSLDYKEIQPVHPKGN